MGNRVTVWLLTMRAIPQNGDEACTWPAVTHRLFLKTLTSCCSYSVNGDVLLIRLNDQDTGKTLQLRTQDPADQPDALMFVLNKPAIRSWLSAAVDANVKDIDLGCDGMT